MTKYFGFAKELLDRGLAREAEVYDENNTYDTAIQFTGDLGLYKKLAAKQRGRILDLGCGTGRVMLPLLRGGYDVEGLDLSPSMLEIAARKLEQAGFTPALHQGDMREFCLAKEFALIIIPYYAMIYMTTHCERSQVLQCCHQHLHPGGLLAFDFDAGGSPLGLTNPWLGFQTIGPDGEVIIQVVQTNQIKRQLRVVNIITYRQGHHRFPIEVTSNVEASVPPAQMESLLAEAGFKTEGFYQDYSGTPYSGGEECIVIAKKPI